MYRTIYEYFDCKDNEELYQLLKSNDKRVSELGKFLKSLEEYKDKSFDELYKISNSIDSAEFFKEHIFPNENEMILIGLNVTNTVISSYRYKPLEEIKSTTEILKELNTKSFCKFVTIADAKGYNDICEDEFSKVKNNLDKLGFNNLDNLKVYENYINNTALNPINYWDYEISTKALNTQGKKYEKVDEITKLKEYDNFIKYYVEKEIVGLDYTKDKEKIFENLKMAYEHLGYEKLGFIKLDENLKVLEVKEYSSGDISSSVVPFNKIIKDFLEDKATNYIMYHNHPSNTLKPSDEDKFVTQEFNRLDRIDKNLIDSVIVSKNGYYSLKDGKEGKVDLLEYNYKKALKLIDDKNKNLSVKENSRDTVSQNNVNNNLQNQNTLNNHNTQNKIQETKKKEQTKSKIRKKSKGLSF